MVITREPDIFRNISLTLEGRPIERMNKFKYLGMWLGEDLSSETEVKCRIECGSRSIHEI